MFGMKRQKELNQIRELLQGTAYALSALSTATKALAERVKELEEFKNAITTLSQEVPSSLSLGGEGQELNEIHQPREDNEQS